MLRLTTSGRGWGARAVAGAALFPVSVSMSSPSVEQTSNNRSSKKALSTTSPGTIPRLSRPLCSPHAPTIVACRYDTRCLSDVRTPMATRNNDIARFRKTSPLSRRRPSSLVSRSLVSRYLSSRPPSTPPSTSPTNTSSSTPSPSTTPSTAPLPHENIYTIPNILTVARLFAAPVVGYYILHDQPAVALGLLAAASVSDLLDGWIARRYRLRTVVGSILDPAADKVLMTVLTVSLAAQGGLPLWLAFLVLGRDAGLGVAAIYYRWISLPPPKTMARYWDFSLPSAEVRPTTISKYNTFLQLVLMAATTAAPVLAAGGPWVTSIFGGPWDFGPALTGLQYIVGITTVWSGLSYVFSKDAVKILTQKKLK